jgi:GT2 family glycosyltransferase
MALTCSTRATMSRVTSSQAVELLAAHAVVPIEAAFDGVVSFVLYHTALTEVRAAIDQVLASAGNYHVVLIDNSVPPLDLDALASADVTVIVTGENLGYGSGHNLALRRFSDTAAYHLVLNTDIAFGPEVIPGLIAFMNDRQSVGLAMPLVRYPNGDLQHLCRILPRPIDIFARAVLPNHPWSKALTRRYEAHGWSYDAAVSFPFLSGCFMIMRPQAIAQTGLFDERFFMFAEDLDLSRRVHRHYDTMLCPSVSIVHEYRTRTAFSWRRKRYLAQSFIRYFNKYGWFFDRERSAMNRRALDSIAEDHQATG